MGSHRSTLQGMALAMVAISLLVLIALAAPVRAADIPERGATPPSAHDPFIAPAAAQSDQWKSERTLWRARLHER